jgi:hypothetical protein
LRARGKNAHNDADDRKSIANVRLEHMSRTPSAFKQTDVTRALKAIRNAGYSAARVLIGKDGQIDITTTTDGEAQAGGATGADADLDHELADWEKRRGR